MLPSQMLLPLQEHMLPLPSPNASHLSLDTQILIKLQSSETCCFHSASSQQPAHCVDFLTVSEQAQEVGLSLKPDAEQFL